MRPDADYAVEPDGTVNPLPSADEIDELAADIEATLHEAKAILADYEDVFEERAEHGKRLQRFFAQPQQGHQT